MTMGKAQWIEGGGVTSPSGFSAGASYAGVKTYGSEPRFDVGLLASDRPCAAAGVFTQNLVCGAPVTLSRKRVRAGSAQAVVVNSGNSNVATGEQGLRDAAAMAARAARRLGIASEGVLVASTGVIGRMLPLDRIAPAIDAVQLDAAEGGMRFARAIMTTDTVAKSRALRVEADGRSYVIGAAAKGAGMLHPNMATMLCFVTTDAPADASWLRDALRDAVDPSFNMLDVDMDTSTSDTVLLLANGAAGGEPLGAAHPVAEAFRDGLRRLCIELTRDLARDGEGARTLIEMMVEGAASLADARRAARTVVASPLVKTMVTGRDPNPGRVLAALGRSGAAFEPDRVSVRIGEHIVFERGAVCDVDLAAIAQAMDAPEVRIRADLGAGSERATAWGCDLTEGYVRINADYTT